MIGIQNSSSKSKVFFMGGETISLPISFLVGVSFISGSITGSLLTMDFSKKKSWKSYKEINLLSLTILEIPREVKIAAVILNTSVFGIFITFWSFLQNLFAIFKSK